MLPRFQELNDAERQWVSSCIKAGRQMVVEYAPADAGRPLDAGVLDRAYAAWLTTGEADGDRINQAINAIGFAFGQLLIDAAGFEWVVVTDQFGCDMGLRALPGKGDVLVYPTHMVAKRWQSRESMFLEPLFEVVTKQVRDVQANWPERPPQFRNNRSRIRHLQATIAGSAPGLGGGAISFWPRVTSASRLCLRT